MSMGGGQVGGAGAEGGLQRYGPGGQNGLQVLIMVRGQPAPGPNLQARPSVGISDVLPFP